MLSKKINNEDETKDEAGEKQTPNNVAKQDIPLPGTSQSRVMTTGAAFRDNVCRRVRPAPLQNPHGISRHTEEYWPAEHSQQILQALINRSSLSHAQIQSWNWMK
jgi:hypothetical protein